MTQITPIIYLILSLIQFIILLRFICQAMDVNYYNPVTQSIVKLSGYILKPLDILGIKSNSYLLFLVLYSFTFIKLYVPLLSSNQLFPINSLVIISFGYLIKDLVNIYWYLIIISAIKSWFNVFVNHPIFSLVDDLCEPLYGYIRSFMPTLSGIDFSPVIILLFLQIIEIIFIPRIFNLTSIL